MSQILEFPKSKSKRILRQRKIESQKTFLLLSLFSFVMLAVFTSEQTLKSERPVYLISDNSSHSIEQVNRAIASAEPMNLFRDVEWEHQLAKKLQTASDKGGAVTRTLASVAQKLTLLDHLRYGSLAGKYRITQKSKSFDIEYVDSQEVADRPVQIESHDEFLGRYQSLFPVEFQSMSLAQTSKTEEIWNLVGEEGQVVGRASMTFDESGHFLGMKVRADVAERISTQ